MRNQSHVIILIETTENQKFGCSILHQINQKGKYIEDSEAFLFKFDSNGNPIEKYSILDTSFSIEIYDDKDNTYHITLSADDKKITVYSAGQIEVVADSDINVTSKGDIGVKADGKIGIKAKGNIAIESDANISMNAKKEVSIQASKVKVR